MADLGLSDREVKRVMAEADFNDDGEISYAEFIPLAVDLVQSMYAKMEAEAAKAAEEEEAREEAKNYLLHGMSKEEVESVMMEIFHKSDADGSGALSLSEFQKCCKDADIGLTRKEINILMHQCDMDGDGNISYEEFVPLCFEMLTEILKDELLQEKRSPSELEVFLVQRFSEVDAEGLGRMSPLMLKDVIRGADLGLTRLQIHSILAEAEYDEEGMADYIKFAPKASELIYRMLDVDMQIERAEAVQGLIATGSDFDTVHGLGQPEVENVLLQEFAAADASGSGVLPMSAMKSVLQGSSLQLSANEVSALLSACDVEEGSTNCVYPMLASYAFYILQYIAQSAAIV
jgi:Ca2+-binding EF-hand superfamily protein